MKFSVIICAHTEERWDDLVEAVKSVEMQTQPPHQIIIVIDHNPSMFKKAQETFAQALVIENHEQRGLNGARNSGVSQAVSEVVAFMDDDAIANPDWLEKLAEGYTGDHVAGVGGDIHPYWLSEEPRWFPIEFRWVVGCTYRGLPTEVKPVRNLIGCNMSYRLDVLQELGGFTIGIGHVGGQPRGDDETEFCIRLHQKFPEKVILHKPDACVSHKVPASRANKKYFRYRCQLEGRSKALLSTLIGTNDGLSSERSYVLKILPSGVFAGIKDALTGDLAGLQRSAAIVEGFSITTFSYVAERIVLLLKRNQPL